MPRNLSSDENAKRAKSRRQSALDRIEFRTPSEPRTAAASATSFPVKARDPKDDAAIEAFLAGRPKP